MIMNEDLLLEKVTHDEFKEFAKTELAKEGFYQKVYSITLILTSLSFCAGVGYGLALFFLSDQIFHLIHIVAGLAFCFTVLIISHELLHALAYKLVGAKQVYFGANLSQFLFYAASDGEKFSGRQFRFIALFPFLTVLAAGVVCLITLPQYFLFTLTALFIHSVFCGGDFAVLNYINQYDLDEVYTFDVKEKKETYFYQRT